MPNRHVVRFAVGTRDGARSGVWRLWTTGNDVYLSARLYGDTVKASLHESGTWRWAFTDKYAESKSSILPPDSDRVIEEWKRPPEIAPGITSAFMIVVPSTEITPLRGDLSETAHKKYTGGVHWVPMPSPGTATHFMILLIAPGGPPPQSEQNDFIWQGVLPNGETLAVMVHEQPITEEQEAQLAKVRRFLAQEASQKDFGTRLSTAEEPRGYIYGSNEYGTRFLVDISGMFLVV